MRTARRPRKRWWRVAGFGYDRRAFCRYPAGAVASFLRKYGAKLAARKLAVVVDPETGGWRGLHVAPLVHS